MRNDVRNMEKHARSDVRNRRNDARNSRNDGRNRRNDVRNRGMTSVSWESWDIMGLGHVQRISWNWDMYRVGGLGYTCLHATGYFPAGLA